MRFFVEVGSCNFETSFQLGENHWRGVICEPDPKIFSKLVKLFDGDLVTCFNCAVTDQNTEKEIELESGRQWVTCYTLDTVIQKSRLPVVNFLKIDAKANALNILKAFDFKTRPKFIKVEHKLSNDITINKILRHQKYFTWNEKNDIYAVG